MPAAYCRALVCVVVALRRRFGSTSVAHMGVEMENRGGCTGVGFWGFGSMLAVTISWSVHHFHPVDDSSRHLELAVRHLLFDQAVDKFRIAAWQSCGL
jgi:hypothetical protein